MRKKIIAGNWKMNASRQQAQALLEGIKKGAAELTAVDILVFPPFVHIQNTEALLEGSSIHWGAQNLYIGDAGAFTGEVSGPMLKEYGCRYVLVGHSERRMLFHDDLPLVAAKFDAAQSAGLIPVLCVGETLEQREAQVTERIIQDQLASVISASSIKAFEKAIIAYEPVWAIGTGLTASPEQAQAVHHFIRSILSKYDTKLANSISILYGGSVKKDNAAGLFAMPDIDGALVGGASLDSDSFLSICREGAKCIN